MTATPGERLIEHLRPFALPLLVLTGVTVLLVVARQDLADTPRFRVDPGTVEVRARPAWVGEELAQSLARQVSRGLSKGASLLEASDLSEWATSLPDLSPWIASVEAVVPYFPSRADVRLRLRRPVLVVEGDILVAATGEVLGLGPVSVRPEPLYYVGSHADEEYRECAAAAAELLPFRDELTRLGVTVVAVGVSPGGQVLFHTLDEVELDWGRSARKSDLARLDLPPPARIANLRRVLIDFPGLSGVRRVRLWTDQPVVTRRGA